MGQAVFQLVYASAATEHFGTAELDDLLRRARVNNSQLGISGVLLFRESSFFQVLEGDEKGVWKLFDTIKQDTRHDQTLVLSERSIDQRNFGDWSMGYIREQSEVNSLPGFVDFFEEHSFIDLHGDKQRMRTILDGFGRGRWHRGRQRIQEVAATSARPQGAR